MKKIQIYYPRTYRKLKTDYKNQFAFLFIVVIPCLVLLLLNYSEITLFLCEKSYLLMSTCASSIPIMIDSSEFLPVFGEIFYLRIPSTLPSFNFTILNLFITLILLYLLISQKNKGNPICIYITMVLVIHLISCVYFLFARSFFPYTLSQYSDLYVKQQVGIWISFLAIAGFITSFMNSASLIAKMVLFSSIMAYSFVFGFVRYITFLFITYTASSLYMPLLFFTLGPFFDFLYLVYFYSLFIGYVVKKSNSNTGRKVWGWL